MNVSENYPKLKLKRKKPVPEQELAPANKHKSGSDVPQAEGPEPPPATAAAAAGLARSGLDSLWALTVQCVLEDLHDASGLVPELPPPSAAKPSSCSAAVDWDLSPEVPPFPEFSLSVQNRPKLLMDRSNSEHSLDTPEHPATPLTPLTPPPHQSPHSPQDVPPQPQRQAAAEGCVHGAAPSNDDHRSQVGLDRTGGLLQSCPMCLLVFPLGFTQLERDSHLAQCLSDMNIDMTW